MKLFDRMKIGNIFLCLLAVAIMAGCDSNEILPNVQPDTEQNGNNSGTDKPDPNKPDPDKPNPEQPDPNKPDPDKPGPEQPDPDKPGPEQPEPEPNPNPDPEPEPEPEPQVEGRLFAHGVSEKSGWYDVNKRKDKNGQWYGSFLHCWAIAASNMLQWWQDNYKAHGYSIPAGAPDGPGSIFELAIYEKMKDSFVDQGSASQVGVHWYFTGEDRNANMQNGNHPKPGTGGYYKDCFDPIMSALGGKEYLLEVNGYDVWREGKTDPRRTIEILSEYMKNALKDGIASLTIRVGRSLTHEITLWGVDLDANGNITHVWITDSDDQMNDHYSKPRTPILHHLEVVEEGTDVIILGYYNKDKPKILAITTLKGYPANTL